MTKPSDPPTPLAELAHELRDAADLDHRLAPTAMRTRALGPLSDTYVQGAETIMEAGRHLLALVDNLTDIARIEAGRTAPYSEVFDAAEVAASVAALLAIQAERKEVALNVSGGGVKVRADRDGLRRVLINLAANAIAATPAGGSITLEARANDGELMLIVKDTGPGSGGHSEGLGLTLVRALCALHGGSLSLTGAPGGGTLATARLPVLV